LAESTIVNPQSSLLLSLVVAMSRNRMIGRNNQLPWRMPADLKYFKELTTGHAVIMGRKTFDSINRRPLPGRTNIIITRNRSSRYDGAVAAHDLSQAIALAIEHDHRLHHRDEIFILGGAEIFREALPRSHRLYRTLIDADIEGDSFFPDIDPAQWLMTGDEAHPVDEKNPYPYRFQILERANAIP
jgi:dihydrofolate reductase